MSKFEAFLGQNYWVAGGGCGFALMADVIFYVPLANFLDIENFQSKMLDL